MDKVTQIMKSAIASILTMAAVGTIAVPMDAAAVEDMEKCYGISKAGKNDCQTSAHSCAGSATMDKQSDAFILVPKGICHKISGGSLEAKNIPDEK